VVPGPARRGRGPRGRFATAELRSAGLARPSRGFVSPLPSPLFDFPFRRAPGTVTLGAIMTSVTTHLSGCPPSSPIILTWNPYPTLGIRRTDCRSHSFFTNVQKQGFVQADSMRRTSTTKRTIAVSSRARNVSSALGVGAERGGAAAGRWRSRAYISTRVQVGWRERRVRAVQLASTPQLRLGLDVWGV